MRRARDGAPRGGGGAGGGGGGAVAKLGGGPLGDAVAELGGALRPQLGLELLEVEPHPLLVRARCGDLARWHAALLRGCGRRTLGYNYGKEREEDDAYWGEAANVLHHMRGCGWAPGALGGELTELCLMNQGLGDEDAKGLAAMVKSSGSLHTLILGSIMMGGNSIGDEGAQALAEAVRVSGSMAALYLYDFLPTLWISSNAFSASTSYVSAVVMIKGNHFHWKPGFPPPLSAQTSGKASRRAVKRYSMQVPRATDGQSSTFMFGTQPK